MFCPWNLVGIQKPGNAGGGAGLDDVRHFMRFGTASPRSPCRASTASTSLLR
jgi:hypothetical protein